MKNILILILITLTFNINASNIYEGKWYKFTDDFIRNCFDGFEETQESVSESSGKTSSFANSLTKKELSDCLSGTPYLDTDAQVNPRDFNGNNSCRATYRENEKINLPSAANGQTVELTSTDGKLTAKYKCSNGNWGSAFNKIDSTIGKNHCNPVCLKWTSNGQVSTCSSLSQVSGNAAVCGSFLMNKEHGRVINAVSQSNYFTGNAQFYCNNGNWNLVSGTATCVSQTCNINEMVAWSDREVVALNSGSSGNDDNQGDYDFNPLESETSLADLRNELSFLSANGKNIDRVVNDIVNYQENNNYEEELEDVGDIIEDPFKDDPKFREKPKCISQVNSFNGITGNATFIKEDKRLFSSSIEARENHKNMIGNAVLNCVKGKWVVNNVISTCRRNTSINCENKKVLGKKNGESIFGYFCE